MKWLARLLFPNEVEVLPIENFFGPGYDLSLRITNQSIKGRIRKIEGIPGMAYGGSFNKQTFYVPADIKTFIIDKTDRGAGNSVGFLLKTPRNPFLSLVIYYKVTGWRANQNYPHNVFKTY